jgi:hypothetical protein
MTNNDIINKFLKGATSGKITRHNDFTGTHTPLFIEGDTLYSYGHHYPLAKRQEGGVWVNTQKYSVTTSKHASLVRSLAHKNGFSVMS